MTSAVDQQKALTLFYSYSHKDEALREKLEEQLAVLRRRGMIADWHDREIIAGEQWKGKIDEHLNSADSPRYFALTYVVSTSTWYLNQTSDSALPARFRLLSMQRVFFLLAGNWSLILTGIHANK